MKLRPDTSVIYVTLTVIESERPADVMFTDFISALSYPNLCPFLCNAVFHGNLQ